MDTSNTHPESSPATAQSTTPSYPHWHDFIAGAAAGVGARAITAPLDLLKIRRQLAPPSSSTTSASSSAAATNTKTTFIGGEWNIVHHLSAIAEKEGGVLSLYRGNVAASYLWMGYSVAQFWMYGYTSEYLREQYTSMYGNLNENNVKVSGAISFTSGAISGVCATVITYPFDLCRTIFAAKGLFPIAASNVTWSNHTTELAASQQQYTQRRPPKTLHEFANRMYQQKGLRGFYAGSAPGLLQIVPYMGINFALHDILVMLSESTDSRVSGVAGMGAGVISKLLVYPLDTVKKRLQAQAFWGSSPSAAGIVRTSTKYSTALPLNPSMYSNKKRVVGAINSRGVGKHNAGPVVYEGMIDCFKQIAKREGLAGFYKGLVPSLLKSSVSTGASFWLFTLTKNVLRSIHDSDHF
mmetsp:Transcript_31885/g.67030  ORF Transcript_31885/g.67030 Transcript_31885/m.67030 type:complete len:410 (+) Transcript_31885:205-1434(+)|eukprot:CAMPEP_0172318310 /NCGR_PEP_ID=MMETSP1058-20130122/34489_1 /TAXON_ID=83371 /ORGANISM="Detonula confervacea, Strain CCMP 353" /LENGTH=409 /DNA_ID=CAMNT_0013033113 /DNA_START=190 /DNA_END=1419 /DNA_ORIENTATION=-